MRITVLRRGGLSVFGGSYDAKRDMALANTAAQQAVTVEFPASITSATLTPDGLTVGDDTVIDNKTTFTISGEGSLLLIATMGDERPAVRIETPRQQDDAYGETF